MKRCYFTSHKGKEIFCIDVNCPAEEFEALLEESAGIIRNKPFSTMLVLAIGGEAAPITTNKGLFIEYLAMNAPHVKASAVAGLPMIQKEMFTGIMSLAQREMKFFNEPSEAMDWLVSVR